MTDQQPPVTTEQLSSVLQQANKVIQTRFAYIGLLMIIAVSLFYIKTKPVHGGAYEFERWAFLERMKDTSDLEGFVRRHKDDSYLLSYSSEVMLFKLKNSNYKDRLPIMDEIAKAYNAVGWDGSEDAKNLFEQPTNIAGINIPIVLWLYFVPFVLAVFFHDLTRVIENRRAIIERFKEAGLEEWRQGPGLLGLNIYPPKNDVYKITRLFDYLISIILLLMPLGCCLLFVILVSYFPHNLQLIIFELICVLIIGVDLLLIFYRENILGFKALVDLSTARSQINSPGKKYLRIIIWSLIPILACCLSLKMLYVFSEQEERSQWYPIAITLNALLLSIGLWLNSRFTESVLLVRIKFTLFATYIYWFFVLLFLLYIRGNFNRLAKTRAQLNFIELSLYIAVGAFLISIYLWPIQKKKVPLNP